MEAKVRTRYHSGLRIFISALSVILGMAHSYADSFSSGEDYFMRNEPGNAIPFLEKAIRERPDEEKAYFYLGMAYFQMKRVDDAISAYKKGAAKAPERSYEFYYNIGNCYFSQGKSAFAKEWYDQAIKARDDFAPAYLNRADALMNMRDYPSAVADFKAYLVRSPESPQRENIEKIIGLIESDLAEAERKKADEAARLAADEARRQQMIADVAASLKDAAGDTESLSAGTEDAEGYSDESELAD